MMELEDVLKVYGDLILDEHKWKFLVSTTMLLLNFSLVFADCGDGGDDDL
jgi:hypothetical protein